MNFTLTITATPELLNALNALTSVLNVKPTATGGNLNTEPVIQTPVQAPMQQPQATPITVQQTPVQASHQAPIVAPVVQQPVPQVDQQNVVPAVPTAATTYTMDQLAVAATQLVDAGRRTELVTLLSTFGAQALTALPKEQYGAFATQLRAMGAKI